jgi:ankyrin repeat protein
VALMLALPLALCLISRGYHRFLVAPQYVDPLYVAVRHEDREAVLKLLELGADLNAGVGRQPDLQRAMGTRASTPLICAARWGSEEMAQFLLDHGAAVEGGDGIRATALMRAAGAGRLKTVTLLLENGAELNRRDALGSTALTYASAGGWVDVVRLLLARGADVVPENQAHETALSLAAQNPDGKHREVIDLLLAAGARVEGWELSYAVEHRDAALVQVLLDHGGDARGWSRSFYTLLMEAARNGDAPTARVLIRHGAEVNAEMGDGETALSLARTHQHPELVELLQKAGAVQ